MKASSPCSAQSLPSGTYEAARRRIRFRGQSNVERQRGLREALKQSPGRTRGGSNRVRAFNSGPKTRA